MMDCSIYRLRLQDLLAVCVLALLALGVVMVQSASTTLSGSVVRAEAGKEESQRLPGPEAVGGLTAATSPGGVDLAWSYAVDPAVVSYRVYRAVGGGTPRLLETVRKPGTRYRDAAAPAGEACAYRVTAVDDLSREGPAATLSVTRPGRWAWSPLGAKHLSFALVAFATFLAVGHVHYGRVAAGGATVPWRSPVLWATAIAAFACVAVLVPGVGVSVNGARRWIKLGPMQVQPSELAKWAAVLFLAWWLTRPAADVRRLAGFLPAVVVIGVLCLLVVIQDFGTAALIALCAGVMLLAGRARLTHILMILLPAAGAAVWFIAHKEYRLRRIMAFRDPYASPQGEGYHMIQSLLSFSTGGVLGRGLGNGIQKLGYLPEDTTDFIFAVICEELGLFGALLTVALYLGVLYVAWQAVKQRCDDFGRLLAFGVGAMLGLQAAINIAVATVSVPTKGLSLPLISAGGSGLIITCAALGLLYSVARVGAAAGAMEDDSSPAPADERPHITPAVPPQTMAA